MTKRSTKQQLLLSAISLLLCVSMLVGSTFAWFTDSVTSTNNIIKSGSLDVTMEWKDATATGKQQDYKDASTGPIFNNDLWEPGYVEAKNVKISNVGTLALKYNLHVAANGEVSDLAEVIEVYFAEGEITLTNREMTELTYVGTLAQALAGMPANVTGDLEETKSDIVTIALKMREDAGNDYQNKSIGADFSVILMATQLNYEEDSFDKNYDDIEIPEMSINKIDGVTYGTAVTGDYYMISVDDYTLTDFTVDSKVTVLGTGNGVNDNDRVFGKNAPLETLTLPEGLEEIKDNALNALPNLTQVNFPSTLKTIGIQSFRNTGMSTLTIPETVETIKYGAFRDMANLTTVTIEGNPVLDNYTFRSCPNLTSIYLLGDDVQFVGGGQFATHLDSGYSNPLTIYVVNDTVAARVHAAQSSATDYVVKVLGENADGSDADDTVLVANATQLQTALDNATDGTVIVFKGNITGDVEATQKKDVDVIINGNGNKFTGVMTVFGNGYDNGRDETLTIKNINFVAKNGAGSAIVSPDRSVHNLYSYSHNVTVDNCTFTDPDGVVDCAAVRHEDGGDKNWTVKNCTVDNTMHSLLQVNNVDLTIDNCKIYSKNGANVNSTTKLEMTECLFDVKGYAVRFGVNSGGNLGEAKSYLIKDSTLKSACNDGDAIVIFRASAVDAVLTLENTILDGSLDFSGNTADTTINIK